MSIREVMQAVGCRSEKTVRLWVQAGKLKPVPGSGGQGKKLLFNPVAVKSLRTSKGRKLYKPRMPGESPNRADVESFAQIMHGYAIGQLSRNIRDLPLFKPRPLTKAEAAAFAGRTDLAPHETAALDAWLDAAVREKSRRQPSDFGHKTIVPLSAVPASVRTFAENCGAVLSRLEIQFIAALFDVALWPWDGWKAERQAREFGAFLRSVWKASGGSNDPAVYGEAAAALRDFYEPIEVEKSDVAKKGEFRASWRIARYRRAFSRIREAVGTYYDKPPESVWKGARKWIKAIDSVAKKRGKWPSTASICTALGAFAGVHLHRQQGKRLLKCIGRKLGRDSMRQLFGLVCKVPRAGKLRQSIHADNRPECEGCGEKLSEDAATCPGCGRLL